MAPEPGSLFGNRSPRRGPGEVVTLAWPATAMGKTTTVKSILGLIPIRAGTVPSSDGRADP